MTSNELIEAPEVALAGGEASAKLARLALAPDFTMAGALAQIPEGGGRAIRPTITRYEQALVPLKVQEPGGHGSVSASLLASFAPIGAKMRPDMLDDRLEDWGTAIILALSDLPPSCIKAALADAVHTPWKFPTDMEEGVRIIAERKLEGHRTALRRLRAMLDEIHRAANPSQPQLEGQTAIAPLTPAELHKLKPEFRRIGLRMGDFSQADLDDADAQFAKPAT